jgi:hypothetical protein
MLQKIRFFLQKRPKTIISWNNKFFNLVGHAYPSIWCVIEWCQKEEATVRTIIQQDAVGYPPVKRTSYRDLDM